MSNLALIIGAFVLMGALEATTERDEMKDYADHPCVRACEEGGLPRRCEYDWTLELYYTLSNACFMCPFNATDCSRPHCVAVDGTSRGIITANRIIPGPAIQVCEGDEIVVNVHNAMETSAGTTIHWHGFLQRGTQHMDGVNLITQCPITQQSTFQYKFRALDPGTYWWHSHAGLQRSDGLFGHLVVRQPPSRDPHSALYDYDLPEHVLSVNDWIGEMTTNRFASHHHDDGSNKPQSMLINGKGSFREFTAPNSGVKVYTPLAEFKVEPAMRYRFRVISAAMMNCPMQFSVDNHTLLVIASDGSNFDPLVVDSFNIFPGERFDFVLIALNATDPHNHWIRVRGLANCNVNKAHQVAVLRYQGAPPGLPELDRSYEAGERGGIELNPRNSPASARLISVDRLNSTEDDGDDDALREEPDKRFYLAMDFHNVDNFRYKVPGMVMPMSAVAMGTHLSSPQINGISFRLPAVPPLTQFADVSEQGQFCNAQDMQEDCSTHYCECTHRLQVALGDVVEFVIVDEGVISNESHPMHLHGYKFRVVGLSKLGLSTSVEAVKALDRSGQLKRKLTRAPLKDTVNVPDGGYTIIRFKADNPGVWLLHCHIEFHNAIGMGLLVQVGEASQFPRRPRNFPTCGDWRFKGLEEDDDADDDDDDACRRCRKSNEARAVQGSVFGLMVVSLGCCALGLLH